MQPRFTGPSLRRQSRGLVQTAYQVMVATASGLTWDSGKILSDAVNQIVDAGPDPATLALIYLVPDLIQQWTVLASAL